MAEVITGFADRTHDIGFDFGAGFFGRGNDFMVSVVKRGADEVVHGGIDDDKVFFAGAFDVFYFGYEDAGVAGYEAAGFHEDFQAEGLQEGQQARGIAGRGEDVLGGAGFPPCGVTAGE